MSIDTNMAEVLANLQPTAEVILKARDKDFTNEDYPPFDGLLTDALRQAMSHYHGGDFFIRNMRDANKPWTTGQARAVANIVRRHLRGEDRKAGGNHLGRSYGCFYCPEGPNKESFGNKADLYAHIDAKHPEKRRMGRATAPANGPVETTHFGPPTGEKVNVLPDYIPELNVDLRSFLPARFAVEDNTGTLRFFIITELKRRTRLEGKFVWTKFRYANEYLEPGDRTVREQAGDTKKLIGKQRIQQPVYFGEEEALIEKISLNPNEAMTRYGKEKGCCAYCGRSLTDEVSRARGIGPDCWEDKHVPQMMRRANAIIAAGKSS